MTVPAPTDPAEIRFEVTFPDGSEEEHDWSLELRSAKTGASLLSRGQYQDREYLTLGPGRYRVVVDCDPYPRFCGHSSRFHPPPEPAPFAPVERDLEVVAGESQTVRVEFAEGGRLRLRATIEGDLAPEVTALLEWFDHPELYLNSGEPCYTISTELDLLFDSGIHPGGGRLEWLDDPASPKRLDFFWPGNEVTSRWGHFLPGRSNLLRDPLPPGRRRLRLTLPGCVPIEREVEIRANAVIELNAQFRRHQAAQRPTR